MQPQPLAQQFLPAPIFAQLCLWATQGVPVDCGPPWSSTSLQAALAAGPHASATTAAAIQLISEDVRYQVNAGFARLLCHPDPLAILPKTAKISRVAVVPQTDRRDRIILDLSADVHCQKPSSRRHKQPQLLQASVNATTADADDQAAVKDLGTALKAVLLFMFLHPPSCPIWFAKLDLSDGFWRLLVERGSEPNFLWLLPQMSPSQTPTLVIPSALQMGWKNSPAYFCTVTAAVCTLLCNLLQFTSCAGPPALPPHPLEAHGWEPPVPPSLPSQLPSDWLDPPHPDSCHSLC